MPTHTVCTLTAVAVTRRHLHDVGRRTAHVPTSVSRFQRCAVTTGTDAVKEMGARRSGPLCMALSTSCKSIVIFKMKNKSTCKWDLPKNPRASEDTTEGKAACREGERAVNRASERTQAP